MAFPSPSNVAAWPDFRQASSQKTTKPRARKTKAKPDSYQEPASESSRLTMAISESTGTRFCLYHQGQADATSGRFVNRGGVKRWMCGGCLKLRGLLTAEVEQTRQANEDNAG